jgi:predicted RNase H-like HicB family nuclease
MSAFTYPARFTAGRDGRVMVEFIDLPRVATDGKDHREAMEEAIDALGSDLSIRLSRREEIPTPSAAKRVSAWCPCRFGSRRNWRFTWRCATSKSTTPIWLAALGSTNG